MPSHNSVTLIGHCTRDVQVKNLPSGAAVAECGLAVNRKYRTAAGEDREDVLFIDFAVFGKRADILAQYVHKGSPLFIAGSLRLDTWEGPDGGKRSKISVVVDDFQFLGGRQGGGNGASYEDGGVNRPTSTAGRREQQSRQQQDDREGSPFAGDTPAEKLYGKPGERPRRRPAAEPPFGDEPQFKEAEIPF